MKEIGAKRDLGHKGQMTIYLSVLVIVVVLFLAFVINIGIFVKSKINLQNAVDAAAYSGASIQARQLTEISYMNWELRNVYKEWMYKYYVLGHRSLGHTKSSFSDQHIDYRLQNIDPATPNASDPYNLPSVCLDFTNQQYPICPVATLPGIPRFTAEGIPGVDETLTSFITALAENKAQDCSIRSNINFMATFLWAYGIGSGSFASGINTQLVSEAPQVAVDRIGALPAALDISFRIRNLERIVNEPPKENVCNHSGSGCSFDLNNIVASTPGGAAPIHERTYKAFMAAWRNLNPSPEGSFPNTEYLKNSFVLTELSPTPVNINSETLSGFLLPTAKSITSSGSTFSTDVKHYVDLQLNLVNFATFYSLLLSKSDSDAGTPTQSNCLVTKTAIPVPGYPLAYTKNPELLTYYAVKGEAYFTGLFSPFAPIKLVAYAAAKPFGGRIGPYLFEPNGGSTFTDAKYISPRASKSLPFILSFQETGAPGANTFSWGAPIPFYGNPNFWAKQTDLNVGGVPDSGNPPKYVIPNLLFDFTNSTSALQVGGGSELMMRIAPETNKTHGAVSSMTAGLFTREQYKLLAGQTQPDSAITPSQIGDQIRNLRSPTKWEAANYLIPNLHSVHELNNLDTPAFIDDSILIPEQPLYSIYAPLVGQDLLYNETELIEQLGKYVQKNQAALEVYRDDLANVATQIRSQDNQPIYDKAANLIHNGSAGGSTQNLDCRSLAGKFYFFYTGQGSGLTGCGESLLDVMRQYWSNVAADPKASRYHIALLPKNTQTDYLQYFGASNLVPMFSAYKPGSDYKVDAEGVYDPYFGDPQKALRNSYSTKFVSFDSIVRGQNPSAYFGDNESVFHIVGEQTTNSYTPNSGLLFINPLSTGTDSNLSNINASSNKISIQH